MWKMTFEVIEIPCNGSHIKDRYKFVNLWGRIDLWCIFNGLFFFSRLQHQTKQQFSLSLRSHRRVTTFSVTSHPENNASLLSDFWSQNFIKRLIYGLIQNIVRSVEVQTSRTLSFRKLARLRDSEHFNLFFFPPELKKYMLMAQAWLAPGVIIFTSCMQSGMAEPLNYLGHCCSTDRTITMLRPELQ